MCRHLNLGKQGEELARNHLLNNGYHLLEANYRHKRSEIDIICTINNTLIFVEVKTKSSASFGLPEHAVGDHKIEMVLFGASHYIEEINWKGDIRFDIISIVKTKQQFHLDHFKDAFH